MTFRLPLVLGATASLLHAACSSRDCTDLGIGRQMLYDAALPESVDPSTATLEVCFGSACDTARLVNRRPDDGVLHCEDLDGRTPKFPTQCTYAASERKLAFTTNTAYGGRGGSERLVVTAIAKAGARDEVLKGTVTYRDATDDAARGACIEAWEGTFTRQ